MHLSIILIFLMLGVICSYPGLVFASHEESSDKSKSNSNNQADTTTDVPTVGNVVIPLQQGDTVTVTTCSDGSDKTNDKICVESAANQEQTVSQPQSTQYHNQAQ